MNMIKKCSITIILLFVITIAGCCDDDDDEDESTTHKEEYAITFDTMMPAILEALYVSIVEASNNKEDFNYEVQFSI
jgi:hypothetical protein